MAEPIETIADIEGRFLFDLAAARVVAPYEACALISAHALTGRISLLSAILVHDERGETVHTLTFANAVEIVDLGPAGLEGTRATKRGTCG